MAVQIQLRRGTAAEWTSANPTLAAGEMGLETDTNKYKIGDGSTAWTSLSYASLPANAVDTNVVDAKGDLIVATADNTVSRLAVGSDGQALVADSAETSGLKWGAVDDTTKIAKSIVDAKGDLIVATADNTVSRLAVGTNGYGLVADSAEASGLKWAAVGDVTTTGTQTLTNKTLTAPLIDGAAVIETFEYYGEPVYLNRISLKNASTFYYGYLGDSSGYEVWWDYPADMPLAGVLGNSDRVDFRLIIGNTSGTDQSFNGISIGNGGNINQKYMNSQYIQTLQVGYTHIFDVTLVRPSTTWMAFIWYYKG